MKSQYEKINLSQGVSLFSYNNYENFFSQVTEKKKEIITMMDNNLRLVFKIDNMKAIKTQAERDFKKEFKERYKENRKIDAGFFKLAGLLNDSDLIENKHSSGKKLSKVINQTPELGEEIVLMYSQIKNSYILPSSYLVISVHPYDFIMMGVGRGWTTCYKPMGEHYTGGYSAALDNYTFLTYVMTEKPNFNDVEYVDRKIYRRLGVFSKDYKGAMLSTQYPYKNNGIEEFTINTLQGTFFSSLGENFISVHDDNIKTYKTNLSQVYNDFTLGIKSKRENLYIGAPKESEILKYGSVVKCLSCNKTNAFSDMPICGDCELKTYEGNWSDKIGQYTV